MDDFVLSVILKFSNEVSGMYVPSMVIWQKKVNVTLGYINRKISNEQRDEIVLECCLT